MQLSTKFHDFFVWYLVGIGCFYVVSGGMSFISGVSNLTTIGSTVMAVIEIITGMLLFQKQKRGFLLLNSLCYIKIVSSILLIIVVIVSLSSVYRLNYGNATQVALVAVCTIEIVSNALILGYYRKRKSIFR